MVSGTYQPGSNLTEPRPKKSKFLKTTQGGIVVMGNGAGYYLNVQLIKKLERDVYATVEWENPLGGAPFVNDAVLTPAMKGVGFSAPDFIKGLKNYTTYTIVVRLYESKEADTPFDTLTQKIRCYVDTTGDEVKGYGGLKPKS